MPRRDDELFNTSSIVPDTDDRALHKAPLRASASRNTASPSTVSQTGIGKQIFVGVIMVVLIATSGLFHYQITQQQVTNTKLQTRLETLESQLGVTSSTANQTSETLGEKLKQLEGRLTVTNSEVAKLWAVANDKTKKSLEEHDKSLTSLQAGLSDIKKALAQGEKTATETARITNENRQSLTTTNNAVAETKSTISALQQRITQGDPVAREASQQAREANQQATMAQEQTEHLQSKLEKLSAKVASHDENFRSIDSFRSSVSSDLGKLKQQQLNEIKPVPNQ
jgi:chromosome segregation ATPase